MQWRDVFPAVQYASVWEPHFFANHAAISASSHNSSAALSLSLQDEDPALDVASKHVIDLLQQFYRTGIAHIPIFVTRDWCHLILEQLGTPPPPKQEQQQSREQFISWERTQRADALLSAMHLMDVLQARKMPFELPRPNARTYRLVLEMYARHQQQQPSSSSLDDDDDDDKASLAVALRARDWVLRMENEYRMAADLSLKPSVIEWNLVLQTYAQSPCTDRARQALAVLTQHMLQGDSGSSTTDMQLVDATSFLFLARACGHAVPNAQAAEAGAHCAAQVWDLLMEKDALRQRIVPTLKSHFYTTMLQSIRHLTRSDLRERMFEQLFDGARAHGKVNSLLVREFLINARPLALVELAMGVDRLSAVKGLSPAQAASKLVHIMPPEWTQHRDGN